jgi:hypothetical protein
VRGIFNKKRKHDNVMKTESRSEREFSTMVALLSAVAFGGMLAIAQALRVSQTGITFRPSLWTAIAFLIGFNALFVYLELTFRCREKTSPLFRRGGLLVLVIMSLGALLYPLRTAGVTTQVERFAGVGAAVCFIGTGLTLIRRFVRSAEREEEEQEAQEREAASHQQVSTPKPESDLDQH